MADTIICNFVSFHDVLSRYVLRMYTESRSWKYSLAESSYEYIIIYLYLYIFCILYCAYYNFVDNAIRKDDHNYID